MAPLTANALHVLERRYLLRDEGGAVVETPEALYRRVARAVAEAEPAGARGRMADRFEARMAALEFLPNSPTLMNAGRPHGQLAACFVLPVDDDLAGIFDALKWAALIHQSGGGTGFAFSRLRPRGDVVKTTHGVASGPVSFMRVYDAATEIIKQGGVRRGANMAVLAASHPDVEEFVDAKRGAGLENFNLSVAAPDALFRAAAEGAPWPLRHPRTGAVVRSRRRASAPRPHRRGRVGVGRAGPRLPRPGGGGEPHARRGPLRGGEPLRRAAAAALRGVHPRLGQPRRSSSGAGASTATPSPPACATGSASSTTCST